MKNLKEMCHNSLIRLIVVILWYTVMAILSITAIPYAIVRGMCNLDYYEDWFDFMYDPIKF